MYDEVSLIFHAPNFVAPVDVLHILFKKALLLLLFFLVTHARLSC